MATALASASALACGAGDSARELYPEQNGEAISATDGPRPTQTGADDGCGDGAWGCPCVDDDDCEGGLFCDFEICASPSEMCGNGVIDEGEECDLGPDNADDGQCRPDCTAQVCGDGVVGGSEACDDGNQVDDDGCTDRCQCRLDFEDGDQLAGWELTGDWARYGQAPNSDWPAVPFGTQGQVLGTDGNRAAPYPGEESEHSSATTPSFVLPDAIGFRSWHVDEGLSVDTKRVLISLDDGISWEPLIDCAQGPKASLPPCLPEAGPRQQGDWDEILVDTGHAGSVGRLRFEYETLDSCCGFDQGWFIDDLDGLGCP
ncbi:MAG: DUF4215 domain-containing protein [Nannocystaceae bacterium]